jgi:hypothetical protein
MTQNQLNAKQYFRICGLEGLGKQTVRLVAEKL